MQNIYAKVLKGSGVDFGAVRDGRNSPLSHFDVDLSIARSISAGTHLVLNVAGDALVSDLDPVNQGYAVMYVQDTNLTSPGSPVYFPPGAILKAPYTQLLIENIAQSGKRLRIFYGVGIDFSAGASGNVNVSGVVSTVDGGRARTNAGQAFMGVATIGALAGNFSYVGLVNPAGSGKNVIVKAYRATIDTAGPMFFGTTATVLANVSVTQPVNKKAGAAGGTAVMRYEQSNGAYIANRADQLYAGPAFQPVITLQEPIVLGAGQSLIAVPNVQACGIAVAMEFTEETA